MNRAFDLGSVKSSLVAPGHRGRGGLSGVHWGPSGSVGGLPGTRQGPIGDSSGSVGVHGGNFGVNQGFIGGLFIRIILGVY